MDFLRKMRLRAIYGVPEHLVQLCTVAGVGAVRAERLWKANIFTAQNIVENADKLVSIMKCSPKIADQILEGAKKELSNAGK